MADELTIAGSLTFDDGTTPTVALSKSGIVLDLTGANYLKNKQTVGATEEALLLGDVVAGGLMMAYNGHATTTISIRPATAETDLIDVGPGEIALFRLSASATAPYVISSTGTAELVYLVFDA